MNTTQFRTLAMTQFGHSGYRPIAEDDDELEDDDDLLTEDEDEEEQELDSSLDTDEE